ncbi:MAG: hypothetical protein ACK5LP_04300 [Campylobacteraceae bacterium]
MKKLILILGLAFLFVGCSSKYDLTLTGFNSNEVLVGVLDESTEMVTVTMPNGEVLSGKYNSYGSGDVSTTVSTGFGHSSGGRYSSGGNFGGIGLGFNFGGGDFTKYALLTNENSTLKMDVIVTKNSGKGFGEAKTNDGREYRIQF